MSVLARILIELAMRATLLAHVYRLRRMPYRPPRHRPPTMRSTSERKAHNDRERLSRHARGYTYEWERASQAFAREHPFCAFCLRDNPYSVRLGQVTDHVIPHKGDERLFWDTSNWQRLCRAHHDGEKQRIEARHAQTGESILTLIRTRACSDYNVRE